MSAAAAMALAAATLVADGDGHYARRAEGAHGSVADPREADLAIAAYRQAVTADLGDLTALARLLRALNFRGAFCGAAVEQQKAIYDEGKRLGQAAVDRLDARAGKGRERVAALRAITGAADVYYWTAAHWGQWGLVRGTFAAARSGVAGRVRDLAQTVVDVDPALEEGGGYRVLGRLHDQAPHLPLITGWVSHAKAVEYLRKSYELGPRNPVTWFFLGEALVNGPHDLDEARRFLTKCAETPPRADYLVESVYYAELARARLASLR